MVSKTDVSSSNFFLNYSKLNYNIHIYLNSEVHFWNGTMYVLQQQNCVKTCSPAAAKLEVVTSNHHHNNIFYKCTTPFDNYSDNVVNVQADIDRQHEDVIL